LIAEQSPGPIDIMTIPVAPQHGLPLQSGTAVSVRLPEIEMLRAIAVLMVLVGHAALMLIFWPSHLSAYIRQSGLQTGVDLFFAISGFVIARSLLPRLASVTDSLSFTRIALDFWIARAWRLLPSAWLWLTAPLILCLAFNQSGAFGSFSANWSMFVAGLLDFANFHLAGSYGGHPGIAFPQWSLSLEEQFYIMLPFAAFFLRRYLVPLLALIALAGFFVPNTPLILTIRLWPVAFGVLLALWARHPSYQECAPAPLARQPLARMALLFIAVAGLISLGAAGLHIVWFYQGPVALISVILVWLGSYDRHFLCGPGVVRRCLEIIAARSYSLYLIHIPVYCAMREIWWRLYGGTPPSRLQQVEILTAVTLMLIAVTELNHRLLERPLREHGKRLVARRRTLRSIAA
jgi:peptidoglycan/LPS O-acetylase OafA/YrhL